MMNTLIIIGAGGHAKQCIEIAELRGYKIVVYDDVKKGKILDYEIYNDMDYIDKNIKKLDKCKFFIAIGDNFIRKNLYEKYKNRRFINLIHPNSFVSRQCLFGVGNYVGSGVSLLQETEICNFNIFNDNCSVAHDCAIKNYNHISIGAVMTGNCTLGSYNFLCANSCMIPKTSMIDNNILGAGSTLLNNISSDSVFVGSPARSKSKNNFLSSASPRNISLNLNDLTKKNYSYENLIIYLLVIAVFEFWIIISYLGVYFKLEF